MSRAIPGVRLEDAAHAPLGARYLGFRRLTGPVRRPVHRARYLGFKRANELLGMGEPCGPTGIGRRTTLTQGDREQERLRDPDRPDQPGRRRLGCYVPDHHGSAAATAVRTRPNTPMPARRLSRVRMWAVWQGCRCAGDACSVRPRTSPRERPSGGGRGREFVDLRIFSANSIQQGRELCCWAAVRDPRRHPSPPRGRGHRPQG